MVVPQYMSQKKRWRNTTSMHKGTQFVFTSIYSRIDIVDKKKTSSNFIFIDFNPFLNKKNTEKIVDNQHILLT